MEDANDLHGAELARKRGHILALERIDHAASA